MKTITQEQRAAIVRRAIAERDAILACRYADVCNEEGKCATGCEDRAVGEVNPSSLEQYLREWVSSLPAGTLGRVHIGTLMGVARRLRGVAAQQQDGHAGSPAPSEPVEQCWCDEQGFEPKGVSCGDCPTRDYKRHPAPSADIKKLMMQAHSFCPSSLSHPRRMEWMGRYLISNYTPSAQSSKAALSDEGIKAAAKQAGFLFHTIPEYAPIQHTLPEEFSERCFYRFARAIEAAHGITPQAGKESGNAS